MSTLIATERVIPDAQTSATSGAIRWQPVKSLWFFAHMMLGLAGVI